VPWTGSISRSPTGSRRVREPTPDEDRTIDQSLAIAWDILSDLPDSELKRIKPEFIQKYRVSRTLPS